MARTRLANRQYEREHAVNEFSPQISSHGVTTYGNKLISLSLRRYGAA